MTVTPKYIIIRIYPTPSSYHTKLVTMGAIGCLDRENLIERPRVRRHAIFGESA